MEEEHHSHEFKSLIGSEISEHYFDSITNINAEEDDWNLRGIAIDILKKTVSLLIINEMYKINQSL